MSLLKSIVTIVLFSILNTVVTGALYSRSLTKNKNQDAKKFEKHTISPGLIMAGYQGWFDAPEDGANRGWYHYGKGGKFEPGFSKVEMWPEMTEYEKQYTTAFKFADGTPATTFSSQDESTVRLHFKWMKDYGIDGVYLQRFVDEIDEGTAIFKCSHRVLVGEGSRFLPIDNDIPSDHYLWLTGQAGKLMKSKKQLPINKPFQDVNK